MSARSAVDVSVAAAPYETILESIESGTRANFRFGETDVAGIRVVDYVRFPARLS